MKKPSKRTIVVGVAALWTLLQVLAFYIDQGYMVVDPSLETAIKVAEQVVKLLKEAIKLLG